MEHGIRVILDKWNVSSGSLESDCMYIEELWMYLEEEPTESGYLTDKDKLSRLFVLSDKGKLTKKEILELLSS